MLFMTRAAVGLLARSGGKVVVIGMAGTGEVRAYREVAAHAAAKTAVAVLSRSLSQEIEPMGISLSLINPGRISFGDDITGKVSVEAVVRTVIEEVKREGRGFKTLDVVDA